MSDSVPGTEFRTMGQAMLQLKLGGITIYTDPYLSESVAREFGEQFRRLRPPAMTPDKVSDADFVFVSHDHLDHCDPETLRGIADASPQCHFVGPSSVIGVLRTIVAPSRIRTAGSEWLELNGQVRARAVAAAHPEVVPSNGDSWQCVGYVFKTELTAVYFAGDTSPSDEVIGSVAPLGPFELGFIPVNEKNRFRDKAGIIGNMSVREAFLFAEQIGVRRLVPIHWDMFADNQTYPEEIHLIYEKLRPSFQLLMPLDSQ